MSIAPHTPAIDVAESISPIVAEKFCTPEELLAMPDGKAYELVGGKLVERKMGAESSRIAQIINARVEIHASDNRFGLSWGADASYRIFGADARKVRRPDGSFIARGRLPNDQPPKGHIEIFPDLVVEVVSPHDLASEIEIKVEEYLQA
ncbi:MAG: Uma2 family endonuclease, partial [Planctomycetia bacterium]|nr:Uma2 family endonuclease [Planctomycetia bacterium]